MQCRGRPIFSDPQFVDSYNQTKYYWKNFFLNFRSNIILSDVSDSSIASGAALIKQTMILIFEGLERLSAFQLGDVFP
jgi:hypothetical protein